MQNYQHDVMSIAIAVMKQSMILLNGYKNDVMIQKKIVFQDADIVFHGHQDKENGILHL